MILGPTYYKLQRFLDWCFLVRCLLLYKRVCYLYLIGTQAPTPVKTFTYIEPGSIILSRFIIYGHIPRGLLNPWLYELFLGSGYVCPKCPTKCSIHVHA